MGYRPDVAAYSRPAPLTSERIYTLSTDSEPAEGPDGLALSEGQVWVHVDTGLMKYWTGSAWVSVTDEQVQTMNHLLLMEIRDLLRGETNG